jgi:excisionase family DNA binding protein
MSQDDIAAERGLTVAEVAARYRVGEDKVRTWIRRGELRAVNTASRLSGRPRWVITPAALAELEAQRGHGGASALPKRPRRARRQQRDYYP